MEKRLTNEWPHHCLCIGSHCWHCHLIGHTLDSCKPLGKKPSLPSQHNGLTVVQSKASQVRASIREVFSQHDCLNSMEVCRYVNKQVKTNSIEDAKACYPRDFGYVTRRERCLCKKRGCQWFSLKVYQCLRFMEAHGELRSIKLRFWDGGRSNNPNVTDVFRFWFKDSRAFQERILRPILMTDPKLRQLSEEGLNWFTLFLFSILQSWLLKFFWLTLSLFSLLPSWLLWFF